MLVARAVGLRDEDAHRQMAAIRGKPDLGHLARAFVAAQELERVKLARGSGQALATVRLVHVARHAAAIGDVETDRLAFGRVKR